MRGILALLLGLIPFITLAAEGPPIVITAFSGQEDQPLKSQRFGSSCFTVQFRVTGKPLFEVERAVVYLFEKNNRLIHTLTEIDPQPLPRMPGARQRAEAPNDYVNVLRSLDGLQPDTIYTLLFRHMLEDPDDDEVTMHSAELRWKFAVVVLGADDQYVYRVFPAWKRVEELEFREKSRGVEQR